jgi:hypothetical protein
VEPGENRRTPCGQRLYFVVRELGYVDPNGVQLARLAADISRRAIGNIKPDQLRAIFGRGREIDCGELLIICSGLDVEAAEILYGEDGPPRRQRRPPGVNLMDTIEPPY